MGIVATVGLLQTMVFEALKMLKQTELALGRILTCLATSVFDERHYWLDVTVDVTGE